jgi:hypothetical protein
MRKFAALAAVCVVALGMWGCKKKEPETAKPPRPVGPLTAPAGMRVVRPGAGGPESAFFLDEKPVTNAEYALFYEKTRAGDPGGWVGEEPPVDRGAAPVRITDPEAARDYAAWVGKRLPTALEWEAGKEVVGDAPYPYGKRTGQSFTIRCALDPGSEATVSEKVRSEVAGKYVMLQQVHVQQVHFALKPLETALKAAVAELKELDAARKLQSYETKLGEVTELQAQVKGYEALNERLVDMLKAKALLVGAKARKATEAQMAAAEKVYVEYLKEKQKELSEELKDVSEKLEALEAEVAKLRKGWLERLAPSDETYAIPALPAKLAETMPELVSLEKKLEDLGSAMKEETALLKSVKRHLPGVETDLTALQGKEKELQTALEAAKAKIAESRKKLGEFSKYVGKDFVEENLVVRAGEQVIRETARLASLQRVEAWLKETAKWAGTATEPAPAPAPGE